jgi:tRNA pseudouridine55 synthase
LDRPFPHGRPSPAHALDPSGILIIDKPAGMTSHDVVDELRRAFGWRKVGHAGTLDPLATGVLVILVGQATRAQARFLNDDKEYQGRIVFGAETSSHDAEGEVVARCEGPHGVTREALEAALAHFRGEIRQLPPMVSAVKHKGKPLYKYARKGEEVAREERPVTIHRLDLVSFEGDEAEIVVRCSKGTYVRTLAHDIGKRLGPGAYLKTLRRTRSGAFAVADARALPDVLGLRREEAFYLLLPAPEAAG